MTDADKQSFADGLTALGVATRQPVTDAQRQVYWMALRDLELADFQRATMACLQTCKFFPAPAELRAAAGKAPALLAVQAWTHVRAAMDKWDSDYSVDFGPLVNATVRNIGGWMWLCEQTLPQLAWAQKNFERVYQQLATADPTTLHGAALCGRDVMAVVPLRFEPAAGQRQIGGKP